MTNILDFSAGCKHGHVPAFPCFFTCPMVHEFSLPGKDRTDMRLLRAGLYPALPDTWLDWILARRTYG
jgi:hypothetical protein